MTAVRFGESTRYGLRLYGYVLAVTVLGGAGVGLGAALAFPEIAAWRGPGQAEVVPGVAGGLLLFLGLSVLMVGYFSVAYKLLADGVSAGFVGPSGEQSVVDEAADSTATAADAVAERSGAGGSTPADPNVGAGEPTAEGVAGEAGAGTEVGSMAAEEDEAASPPENPPEPSPEEIAFGSSSDEGSAAEDASTEDDSGSSSTNSGPLPGQNASSDPLADPSDE